MPRIKISAITNIDDAKWAAILGVEYISVSLDEVSDKKVSMGRAIDIRNMLPSYTGFVAEFGEVSQINLREVKKLTPGYIQFKNELSTDVNEVKETITGLEAPVIYEMPHGSYEIDREEMNVKLLQIDLAHGLSDDQLKGLKVKYDMENTIIEGDWALPDIKKACEILQPYAWSIKNVIEKSPRKIDYNIMKKYIREISLW